MFFFNQRAKRDKLVLFLGKIIRFCGAESHEMYVIAFPDGSTILYPLKALPEG